MSEGSTGPETNVNANADANDGSTMKNTVDLLCLDGDVCTDTSRPSSSSSSSSSSSTSYREDDTTSGNFPSSQPSNRGRKHVLPDDFLRPPGWSKNQLTLGDEQLALMLQNELFRREVQAAMGQDVFTRGRGSGRRGTGQGRTVTAAYTDGTNGGPQTGAGSGDLGIMKALSEMGTGNPNFTRSRHYLSLYILLITTTSCIIFIISNRYEAASF